MKPGQELAQQFAQENKQKPDNVQKQTSALSELLGITAMNMVNTITDDIANMIQTGYTKEIEGYILCLSRIMKHDTAWECIQDGFKRTNEKIPQKYYALFGKDPDKLPKRKGMRVDI